jgi:hypothetical protein
MFDLVFLMGDRTSTLALLSGDIGFAVIEFLATGS